MAKFWLIQTGRVTTSPRNNPFGPENIINNVDLDYMGAAEFEWGALPKALARMMHSFEEYTSVHTGIFTPDGDEIILFSKSTAAECISCMLQEYLSEPYDLKGCCPLSLDANLFWWNIEYRRVYANYPDSGIAYGDWMACTESNFDLIKNSIDECYEQWLKLSDEDKKKLYYEATH